MLTTTAKATAAAALLLAASALGAGAGRSEDAASRITVFAASSLTDVFPKIDRRPRYSFASSSTLAQQIRQGAPADVFASADLRNPQELRSAGLCGRPLVFATNALVVVYPRSNPGKVKTVFDLRRPGVKVVIAEAGRADRRLHAHGAQEARHLARRARERRQPGARRAQACSRRSRSVRPTPASSTARTRRPSANGSA